MTSEVKNLARGLVSQAEVVHAVILRETRTRFGAHDLGYMWALLEPVLMILTFYLLFAIAGRGAPDDMDLLGFLATGILPYVLFISSVTRVADSVNGNKGLLFYPHVQPLDLVYARCLLELMTYFGVFILLMGGNAIYRQELNIDSALLVIYGLVLASLLGTTLGLMLCSLALLSNVVERVRGPMLRPMFWVSGVFFAANQLPDVHRERLLYNPLLHCVEYVRGGWYPSYDPVHADGAYVMWFILIFAAVGLPLERAVRHRIEVA